jgi:TolB-like protein
MAQIGEAAAWAELGKPAEAESRLTRLLAEKGAVGDAAATDLAAIRRAAGNGDAALKVVPASPMTPVGWLVRGLLLAEHKQLKPAVQALKTATDEAPTYVDAWLQLARVYEGQNDAANARMAAEHALDLSPSLVDAIAIRARAFGREGNGSRQAAELVRIRELAEKISATAARHTVAVVVFDNTTGDPTLDWARGGVADALVSDLGRIGSLTTVELADAKDASKAGRAQGADTLLLGSISKAGDQLRLDGRVVDIATSKVIKSGSATGGVNQLVEAERKLAIDLLADFSAITGREKADFLNAKAPSLRPPPVRAETVLRPDFGAKPEVAAKPEAAAKPEVAAKPEAAEKPEAVAKPEAEPVATPAAKPAADSKHHHHHSSSHHKSSSKPATP